MICLSKSFFPEQLEFRTQHYKAYIHFFSQQSQRYADRVYIRYCTQRVYKTLTYAEVDRISTNLACQWSDLSKETNVVSFLGVSGVDYTLTILALMKLRLTVMLLSPRNSEAGHVSLLKKTKSKTLMAASLHEKTAKNVAIEVDAKIRTVEPFDLEALANQPLCPHWNNVLDLDFSEKDIHQPVLIIHSSGTTGFPNPIYLSNQNVFYSGLFFEAFKSQNNDLNAINEHDVVLACAPLFHAFGFSSLTIGANSGLSLVFLENYPPSQQEIDQAMRENNVTALIVPPTILEDMMHFLQKQDDFSAVRRLKYVAFGGAPLRQQTGEWFREHGVNVRNSIGSTEGGPTMSADMEVKSHNWYTLGPLIVDRDGQPYYVFEDIGDGLKHMVIRAQCPSLSIGVANRSDGGYNTNDLFRESLDFANYYTYVGRLDDTLIMENGEKTNPVPMESAIRQCSAVKQVAVLGHGRQCTVALIEMDRENVMSYSPDEISHMVHRAVEEVNRDCPSHSVILPQMVKILPFNKSLPCTDKGTLKRKMVEIEYKETVEALYKSLTESPRASKTSRLPMKPFLIKSIAEVLHLPELSVDHSVSVFDMGLTSLTAIQLRNLLVKQFGVVSQSFLYQHPTVISMCEALSGCGDLGYEQTQLLAQSYIERARSEFPTAQIHQGTTAKKTVLLTGATGSLGSFMLRDLLRDANVEKVYCLVRGEDPHRRLTHAFVSRGLDPLLLETRVEVLSMCLTEPYLGLTQEHYNRLKAEIDVVQHCAWLLDFNLNIQHYDKACIAPFYNLIRFAYRGVDPMHLHFISSISASACWNDEIKEVPLPLDSRVSMSMGYAQSKFVCESLINYLVSEKNMPCSIERVGQVCGDSINGIWNISEQFPLMMVAGGNDLRKMPALDTHIDWVPVDYVSAAIVDIMLNQNRHGIYHIVNPRGQTWSSLLQAMRECGMEFEVVDPYLWLKALSEDDTNPAFKLMAYFENSFRTGMKLPKWQTTNTASKTSVLERAPKVDSKLLQKYFAHWKSIGAFT